MKRLTLLNGICYSVGFVFIVSGVTKLMVDDFRIIFHNLALPYPNVFLFLVAITEIVCSTLIVSRLYLRQAAIPLICIMIGAIFLTKIPILTTNEGGVLSFLFEARLDLVMLLLLIVLWQHAPRKT